MVVIVHAVHGPCIDAEAGTENVGVFSPDRTLKAPQREMPPHVR